MFTSIMNGVINEVTRHPAGAPMPRQGKSSSEPARHSAKPRLGRTSPVAPARIALPGRYRVLADSFKRAAGFY